MPFDAEDRPPSQRPPHAPSRMPQNGSRDMTPFAKRTAIPSRTVEGRSRTVPGQSAPPQRSAAPPAGLFCLWPALPSASPTSTTGRTSFRGRATRSAGPRPDQHAERVRQLQAVPARQGRCRRSRTRYRRPAGPRRGPRGLRRRSTMRSPTPPTAGSAAGTREAPQIVVPRLRSLRYPPAYPHSSPIERASTSTWHSGQLRAWS